MAAPNRVSAPPAIGAPEIRAHSVKPNSVNHDGMQTTGKTELTAGWLYKWTNYLKGYRKRWFVLQSGVLSYYRNQAAANRGATSRGTIVLRENEVRVAAYERDSLVLVLHVAGASRVYLKAPNEAERARWFAALRGTTGNVCTRATHWTLESTPTTATRNVHNSCVTGGTCVGREGEQDEADGDGDGAWPQLELDAKLVELRSYVDALAQQQTAFERDICQLETVQPSGGDQLAARAVRALAERSTLLRTAAASALRACDELAAAAALHGSRCRRLVEHERTQRRGLETLVEQLAWQHRSIERQARKSLRRATRAGAAAGASTTGTPKPTKKPGRSWLKRSSHGDTRASKGRTQIPEQKTNATVPGLTHSCSSQNVAASGDAEEPGAAASTRLVASATHAALVNDTPASHRANDGKLHADETALLSKSNSLMPFAPDTPGTKRLHEFKQSHFDDDSDEDEDEDDDEDDENDFFDALDTSPADSPSHTNKTSVPMLSSSILLDAHQRFQSQTTLAPTRVERGGSSAPSTPLKRADPPVCFSLTLDPGPSPSPESLASRTNQQSTTGNGARPRVRRSAIMPKPAYSINLWSILKNCVGNELSRIPMPVNFSEPISLLQRFAEDFEYSICLDRAAQSRDPFEAIALVAAFAVSPYSSTVNRTTKPFNPLLGETYEMDRSDESQYGWRLISEQVSHHPPTAALHCEAANWTCFEELTMKTKFRGKFIQIQPFGVSRCDLRTHDGSVHRYSWTRVTTTVHNVIVGRLWIDHHGEMLVRNHSLGLRCQLKFAPSYSFFSRDVPRKVNGAVYDDRGVLRYALDGCWDERLDGYSVLSDKLDSNGQPRFGERRVLWQRNPPLPGADRIYHFTRFAVELNEFEPDVAPTDSRRRPDQRLMENGEWDAANREKLRLEEKQRAVRKLREDVAPRNTSEMPCVRCGSPNQPVTPDTDGPVAEADVNPLATYNPPRDPSYEPRWFELSFDACSGSRIFMSNGRYWPAKTAQDWTGCPDIF